MKKLLAKWLVIGCVVGLTLGAFADAQAADFVDEPTVSITTLFGSHHFDSDTDYNETNPGLGIEVELPNGATYGFLRYYNSYENWSNLMYIGGSFYRGKQLQLGVMAGFVTGYEDDEMSSPIAGGLTASFEFTPEIEGMVFGIPGEVIAYGMRYNF